MNSRETIRSSTMQRLLLVVQTYWKHGRFGLAILTLTGGSFLVVFTRITLLMDYLFIPDLWKIEVHNPVFIIGHPRSGTTFFQQRIYEADRAAMFTTWEILFPSVTVRKVLYPIIRGLKWLGVDVIQGRKKGHQIRLDEVEEEEALFLHRLDSEILHILCPWLLLDDELADDGFRLGWEDFTDSNRSVKLLREFLKRQMYYTGHSQIVAKLNPSIFRLETLLQEFQDAKIVYIVREPHKSIRSFLSFHYRFVNNILSEDELEEYFTRKYHWSLMLYRYFETVKSSIPPDQLLIIHFSKLIQNPKDIIATFFNFSGIHPSEKYWTELTIQLVRHHKSHRNPPLSKFGITPEDIEDDLDYLWDEYNL